MRYYPLLALLALSYPSVSQAATVCNGYAELCSKAFNDVTVVGAHNSYTASNTNLAANQDYGVTQQLTDGVRLLQNQVHLQNGQLRLCHTSCLLYDGGLLSDYLTKVKTWMDANPTEVVTILLVNIDNQPATSIAQAYVTAGLDKMSYSPPSATLANDAWPTYGTLIDSGTRLVNFMDNTANFASVPYIIDEFSNLWESHFDIQDASGFNCTIDRFTGKTDGQMYLINHYLYTTSSLFGGSTPVPNKAALNVTNAVSGPGSLGEEAGTTCIALHGRAPTFLLVDFYEYGQGSVFQVAATHNNVTYVPKAIAAVNGTDNAGPSSANPGSVTSTPNAAGQRFTSSLSALSVLAGGVFFGSLVAL
ncbi:hypothetical protein FRB99_007610 [Tulasnella sp. 403]|nr:hypothetical protein FRB99_007610 [Tulasnella sp. 403]